MCGVSLPSDGPTWSYAHYSVDGPRFSVRLWVPILGTGRCSLVFQCRDVVVSSVV